MNDLTLFELVGSIFIKNDDANSKIGDTTKKAKDMASTVGSAFQKAGKTISNVGKAIAPVSAVVGTAFGASVKGASDFRDGMAKMSTLFDTTQTSVGDLSEQFLDLSNKMGLSATELAEAGYQALSAGQSVDNVAGFVETAGKLAKAGFTSTSTAVDVLTTAMNAYGESAGTAEEISNKLVRTQNLGKTTVDELASSMGKIIPTASGMNVNIDNLTSGYVSLTKQGIATAEATTYMNSMLNELGDSGTDLGGIIKDQTGKSFQDLMQEGWSLADVLKLTKDYADENGIAYNELWGSAEAGKAGMAILNGGVEEFNNTVGVMAEKTDDVGEALDKLNTPSAKAKKSLNQLKNSGVELGTSVLNALLPTIDKVVGGVEKATTWFNSLDDRTKTMIGTIMAVVASLAPVLMVGEKVVGGIGTFIKFIPKIKSGITMISGGFKALWGVLSANPIILIIGLVAGLVAGFVYLWNTSEEFRNFWIDLWNQVRDVFNAFVEQVKSIWETIKAVFQVGMMALGELINLGINIITLPFQFIWENCKDIIIAVWDVISSYISEKLAVIQSVISTVMNAIQSVIDSVMNVIRPIITTAWNAISNTVSTVMTTISSVVSTVWNAVKSTVSSVINSIKTTISSGLNSASSTVSSVLSAIENKFRSIMDSAKSIVSSAIEAIKSKFNFSWSLPHLKLPHFSVSGEFSLNPPSVPHFDIDWYKKAMDKGALFTEPTLFDVNPLTGRAKGAGEAGDEVMLGKETMLSWMQEAVGIEIQNAFGTVNGVLERIFSLLAQYIPELMNRQIVLDTGAVVGEFAPMIDDEFGEMIRHKGRGN